MGYIYEVNFQLKFEVKLGIELGKDVKVEKMMTLKSWKIVINLIIVILQKVTVETFYQLNTVEKGQ